MGPDGDLVATRLGRRCRCFVAWTGDELAGYGWLSTGPEWIGEVQLEITPRAGEGYIWNCVTVPERRRRGVFRSLLLGITEQARRDGLVRLWIGSVAIPAEKAVGYAGYTPVLHFSSRTRAGLHWLRVTPAPQAGSAVVAAALEEVSVRPGTYLRCSRPRRH